MERDDDRLRGSRAQSTRRRARRYRRTTTMIVPRLLPTALLALVAFRAMWFPQEPTPTPAPAAPVPSSTPAAGKAVPGTPVRHPLEGVYELRRRRVDGRIDERPGRGHVAITQRHLFFCFAAPGPDPDRPLLRSGVRTWSQKAAADPVDAVVQLGWFTDAEGGVHLEVPGTAEPRRMVLERGLLRIVQDARNDLEFERVE